MGGRGYHNDVNGYLNSDKRTSDYAKISDINSDEMEFIIDIVATENPVAPEFSNSKNKIYVLLNSDLTRIKNITVYDSNHEQIYSIHLDHYHNGQLVHVHAGVNKRRYDIELKEEHLKIIEIANRLFSEWRNKYASK